MKFISFFSLLIASAIVSNNHVFAQLMVDTSYTPTELVQNILVGQGVLASNVTSVGFDSQHGFFNSQNSNIGMGSGVILSNGNVDVAIGPNDAGGAGQSLGGNSDLDLTQLANVSTFDLVKFEFDFIPSGNVVEFKYVFASEEYNEYVCANVNDAFGFFLNGPGITGPYSNAAVNIATIPGGTIPVSINTVNVGVAGSNGSESNCTDLDPNYSQNNIYFVNNPTNQDSTDVQYDGFTVELTAISDVMPDSIYHIKIALADGGDGVFDSGVFLKTSSLRSYFVGPVGIENDELELIQVSPQPAVNTVSFGVQGEGWNLTMMDVLGQVKMEQELVNNSISVEHLNSGLYVAIIQNSATLEMGYARVIIQ